MPRRRLFSALCRSLSSRARRVIGRRIASATPLSPREDNVAEVLAEDSETNFSDEIALTRKNLVLRQLLAERSREPGIYTIDEAREKLGLK